MNLLSQFTHKFTQVGYLCITLPYCYIKHNKCSLRAHIYLRPFYLKERNKTNLFTYKGEIQKMHKDKSSALLIQSSETICNDKNSYSLALCSIKKNIWESVKISSALSVKWSDIRCHAGSAVYWVWRRWHNPPTASEKSRLLL